MSGALQPPIESADLPGLFQTADNSSTVAQERYLLLVRLNLGFLVLGAGSTSWALSTPGGRVALAIVGAIALLAGFGLTSYTGQTQPDRQWFGSRAVAESVKTLAWRYMTCAEPYVVSLAPRAADVLFAEQVSAVLRERSAIGPILGGPGAAADQISTRMRQLRGSDLETRKATYLRDRIQAERQWYGSKAQANVTHASRWLVAVAGTQVLAAIAAAALIRWAEWQFNVASVMATIAAAFLAWLQVKQHQELARAYGLAAHELGLVETRAGHVQSEEEFSGFVGDAESAISREHTMWVARRDVV